MFVGGLADGERGGLSVCQVLTNGGVFSCGRRLSVTMAVTAQVLRLARQQERGALGSRMTRF